MTVRTTPFRPPPFPTISLNKVVVSAYKFFGLVVLFAILLGLGLYLGQCALYFVHRSWVAPVIITASDPRVQDLSARRADASSRREAVAGQAAELRARLADAERTIEGEKAFQGQLKKALGSEMGAVQSQLRALDSLDGERDRATEAMRPANEAFAQLSRDRMQQLFDAHLIDNETMLTMRHLLAEMAGSDYGFKEKGVELQTRTSVLRHQLVSLAGIDAMLGGKPGAATATSPDMVRLQEDYLQSVVSQARATDLRGALAESIQSNQSVVRQYDRMIKDIDNQPLMKAATENMTAAFAPYENLDGVQAGTAVYGCRLLGVLGCFRVGAVVEILEGEVLQKHPVFQRELRGQLVQVQLDDVSWAHQPVLHLRRGPLFF
jgi:hypothetical protein